AVRNVSESAMRFVVGQSPSQSVTSENRAQIELDTRTYLQNVLDFYEAGIEVTGLQLERVDPPAPVIDAFRDVQRAKADQERMRNEAEAYRNEIIPQARGQAEQLTQEAEAYKQEVVARAEGDAGRFLSVYKAYQADKDVTVERIYIETLEDVLSKAKKILIDSEGAGAQGVVPYLPLPEIDKARTRPASEGDTQ
ncbi:MAG: FtsH protease activity modulator HflK, partial [Alphaproteobacteria bacterium]